MMSSVPAYSGIVYTSLTRATLFTILAHDMSKIFIMDEREPMRVSISSRDFMPFLAFFGHLRVRYGTSSTRRNLTFEPVS